MNESEARPAGLSRDRVALLVTLVVAVILVWPTLDRGWTPHDEGMLGQTAERIRLGQLPHRDFEEVYTGALGYWHAGAQSLFGTTLMAARYALFAAWLGWLVLVFACARRASPQSAPWWAAAATVVLAMWTLPVYPSAMPSWYLLFVGTAALAALLRWRDTDRTHWLAVAGLAIGVGLIIKITALYLLAAGLLALVIMTQDAPDPHAPPARLPSIAVIAGVTLLTLMVAFLLRTRLLPAEILHLILPIASLAVAASVRELPILRTGGRTWGQVMIPIGWLITGVVVPVLLFMLPYALSGSLDSLMRGVFSDAIGRVGVLGNAMKPAAATVLGLVVVALAAVELQWGASRIVRLGCVLIGVVLAWSSANSYVVYQVVWEGARWLLPVSVVFVAVRYIRIPRGTRAEPGQTTAMISAAFAALLALNQYPFSAPVYFCFVAPLAFLVMLQAVPEAASRLPGTLVLLGLFAVLSIHPGNISNLGWYPAQVDLSHRLALPRGGLRVSAVDSALFTQIDSIIAAHRTAGGVTAGPAMPEVTFLSGPPYRGRLLFHLIPHELRDSLDLPRITADGLPSVMVWNLTPYFGEPVGPAVKRWFDGRLSEGVQLRFGERHIEIRWAPTHHAIP